jgi:hypothetical protein
MERNPMKTKSSIRIVLASLVAAASMAAQQAGPPAPTPEAPMNAAEKQFRETMSDVTLKGFFTSGDSADTHEDGYTIGKITKIGEDLWNFEATIEHNKKPFKATINVPVKWAGDTPVLTLSNYLIRGHGVYSARILIYGGMYAGTWGTQSHGGKMFGKVVKNEPAQ